MTEFPPILERFLPYLVNKNVLQFTQNGNYWYIAQSFLEYISILTKILKEFIIENGLNPRPFFETGLLMKGCYRNNSFFTRSSVNKTTPLYTLEGKQVCIFKGNVIRVTITNDIIEQDDSRDLIVNPDLANFILYKILNVLNYGSVTRSEDSPTEEDGTVII